MENAFAQPHEYWMRFAFHEAEKAFEADEVPIGCIIVKDNRIVGKGHNQTEQLLDPTAHAEMIAITAACTTVENKFLTGCTLYVTLEPCPMCAGAIVNSRVERVVFGAYDPKAGACGTLFTITEDDRLNHRTMTLGGVLDAECGGILKDY
ncbi:MAG TPA: tRNA adenosine(34) deaminase TadA, partial [Candidatus Kapabacteria bacterium]|nr:tRNA adenosine(34) deaminase TadA [Candidatus Kapabacteria bacterium]